MNFREYHNEKAGDYDVLMDCSSDEIVSLVHAYGLDHTYGELMDNRYYFLLDTKEMRITPVNDPKDLLQPSYCGSQVQMSFHAKDWQFEQYTAYEKKHNLNYTMESADTAQYLTAH